MRPKYYLVQENQPEKAVLVGVQLAGMISWQVDESMQELANLARTAGADILFSIIQKKSHPDPALFLGRGKVDELARLITDLNANLILFDEDLTPAQQRNLEKILEIKIVDRTELILDIFAQRAHTREGKIQVELAQLHYRLPRLTGKGILMSQLGGGIGTRGPGETKLEVDRRRIRARISHLESLIEEIRSNRAQQRTKRKKSHIPLVTLVGYTNAGKSTLLNKLSGTNIPVEDKLFATLDPTTRKLDLPNGETVLLSDTVGFIKKLPHHLVAAFRATMEEIRESDLLLHIVDSSHPYKSEQINAVLEVLREIEALDKPIITVWNKIDRFENHNSLSDRLLNQYAPGVMISAENKIGFDKLMHSIMTHFENRWQIIEVLIPHERSDLVAQLYAKGKIQYLQYLLNGTKIKAAILPDLANQYKKFKLH